jgi:hypothetical protein
MGQIMKTITTNGWIKTSERLPQKPGVADYEHVWCLIVHKGEVIMRPWNCEHGCWDQEDGDDFQFEATEPSHWMPLPEPPHEA